MENAAIGDGCAFTGRKQKREYCYSGALYLTRNVNSLYKKQTVLRRWNSGGIRR